MIKAIVNNIQELRKVCAEVEPDEDISTILQDLKDTLATKKGYGLAANQIGVQKKIAYYVLDGKEVTLINPKIVEKDNKITFKEGCLSFPGIVILTDRYNTLTIELDRMPYKQYSADGIEAIIIQHEVDHLNGITIFQRKHKAK